MPSDSEIIASIEKEVFPVRDKDLFNDGLCFFVICGDHKAKCVSCNRELSITSEIALDAVKSKCSSPKTQGEIRSKLSNELPSAYILYGRFARAFVNYVKSGAKARSGEEIVSIFDLHCKVCSPFYDSNKGICLKCGCNVNKRSGFAALNKIAWESEHCPIGKW